MKKILSLLFVGLLVFSLASCGKLDNNKEEKESKSIEKTQDNEDSKRAIDFQLKDLDGNAHKLEDYKGKKLLIEFWASWCHICVENLPHMSKIVDDKDKGFEVITVIAPNVSGEQSLEKFKEWFKSKGYTNIPVLVDEGGQLLNSYGVRAFPTNVIIDSNQNVEGIVPGAIPESNLKKIFQDLE